MSVEGTASALMANAPTELYVPSSPKHRSARRLALFGVLGVGALGAVIVFLKMGEARTSRASAIPPTAPATLDPKSELVTVRLSVTPTNATMMLDGQRVSSPYEARVPRETKDHIIRIEAPGFDTRTEHVQFANDLTMVFELVKSAPPPPVAVAPKKSPVWRPPPPQPKPPAQPDVTPAPPAAPAAPPATTNARIPGDLPTPTAKPKPDIDKGDPWRDGNSTK